MKKQIMSNSYIRASRKKQNKLSMKQANERNAEYEIKRKLIIDQLRNDPFAHDLNNLDR